MEHHSFQVLKYGVFDSRVALPRLTRSVPRLVNRFELELMTEDSGGTAYIDGSAYPLKKGLFICAKPGQQRHSQLPMRCHYVHLRTEDPALLQHLQHFPDGCRLSDPSAVQQVLRELAALTAPKDTAGELLVQSLVAKLLSLVSHQTAAELRTDNSISRSHRALLQETEVFIRSHLAEDLSLERLSRRAKFSPSHFHRIFTAWFGKTPHEFILSCRIEAAKASLQADNCSLIELAAACGFSSQSHFSAQFKKATGQTPLQYRRQMLSRLEL